MSLVNLANVCSHLQNASKARLGLTSIPVSKLHVALMLSLQKQGLISSVTLGGPAPPKPVLLQPPPQNLRESKARELITKLNKVPQLIAEKEMVVKQLEQKEAAQQNPEDASAPKGRNTHKVLEREKVRLQSLRDRIPDLQKRLQHMGFDAEGNETTQWPEALHDAYPAPANAAQHSLLKTWSAAIQDQAVAETAAESEPKVWKEGITEWAYREKVPNNPALRRLWVGLKYWKNEPVLNNMRLISKPTRRIWVNSDDLAKITRGRESAFVKGLTKTGECMFVTTDRGIMEARECVEKKLGGMVLCRVI